MPAPFRVIVTDFLHEADVEAAVLGDLAELVLVNGHHEDDLAAHLDGAAALLVFHDIDHIGEKTFSAAPALRGVVRAGVGFNNVDIMAAGRRGIPVCNVPDYGAEEVADHAILLLLAVARRLTICDRAVRGGVWEPQMAHGAPRLRGKTLGLVGCGRIGMATALRAKPFGLDVAFYDPFASPGLDKALGIRRVDRLETLLEQSDFISLHCYLDDSTHHLIDAAALARLKPGAIVVNTARGAVIDQEALIGALESGHLGGAGLDVTEREPLDDDRLRSNPNVVLTPHTAFYSMEGYEELRRKAAEEVARLLRGETPRCPVNSEWLAAKG